MDGASTSQETYFFDKMGIRNSIKISSKFLLTIHSIDHRKEKKKKNNLTIHSIDHRKEKKKRTTWAQIYDLHKTHSTGV